MSTQLRPTQMGRGTTIAIFQRLVRAGSLLKGGLGRGFFLFFVFNSVSVSQAAPVMKAIYDQFAPTMLLLAVRLSTNTPIFKPGSVQLFIPFELGALLRLFFDGADRIPRTQNSQQIVILRGTGIYVTLVLPQQRPSPSRRGRSASIAVDPLMPTWRLARIRNAPPVAALMRCVSHADAGHGGTYSRILTPVIS